MAIRWEWIDSEGRLTIPAEVRKGGDQDMAYRLHADTLALLERLRGPSELVFDWPLSGSSLWLKYKRLRKLAGMATDRKSGFHRMRKSVASFLQAAGVDASVALSHSSAAITKKSYLDPRIVKAPSPSEVLPRPVQFAPRLQFTGASEAVPLARPAE